MQLLEMFDKQVIPDSEIVERDEFLLKMEEDFNLKTEIVPVDPNSMRLNDLVKAV